ncbi:MAG: hypothetical protein ABJB11_13640 [Ferruginibacter sp.]
MSYTTSLPAANSHFITVATAASMTGRYRTNRETILATSYKGQDILPLSETFNRGDIDTLLSKTGCAGLRIYFGMDENLKIHSIIVAVNENNEDILPAESTNSLLDDEDDVVEEGQRCPNLCPPPSPLNG